MDKNKIANILESFSTINGFEYDRSPLPYIPFGGIKGTVENTIFTMYIYRSETRACAWHHTVFSLSEKSLVPEGFCIEYTGNQYSKEKSFYNRISILSYDEKIVKKVIDVQLEADLIDAFNRIDHIDIEIFKIRSTLRISEDGIALEVGNLFQNIEELNAAYSKVIGVLIDIKSALRKTDGSF